MSYRLALLTLVFTPAGLVAQDAISDERVITASTRVAPGLYRVADAGGDGLIRVRGDDITLDLSGVTIAGSPDDAPADQYRGLGIVAEGCKNLSIKGLTIRGFKVALRFKECDGLTLTDCDVSRNWRQRLRSTPRAEDGADWLFGHDNDANEWLRYGAGVYVESSRRVTISRCRARNGQNGICLTRVDDSAVFDNDMSFLSGWGLAMWRSSRNDVSNNKFDWCIRGFSHKVYHRGQDSTGILVYEQCHDNVFAYNSATHGGDGFFLYAGNETLQHTGEGGCNRNLLYRNDFSHAAANGIEATFSDSNLFVENRLDECDHGVWGGYSYNTVIAGNTMRDSNHGVSIEHGHHNRIERNRFERCGIAVNLWADANDDFKKSPFGKAHDTSSHHYTISGNTISGSRLGLRLANTSSVTLSGNTIAATEPMRREGTSEGIEDVDPAPPAFTVKVPKTRGTQNAYLPEGARRGWKYIFVDEWGPYDFSDVRLFPADAVVWSDVELTVLGPEGDFTVTRAQGVEVEPRGGKIPGVLRLSAPASGPFTVEVTAGGRTASARGYILRATWSVEIFQWEPQGPQKPPKDWAAVLASKPVASFKTPRLEFQNRASETAPTDYFATVAETEIELASGEYEVGTISDDGVRVYVDGALVIDNWTWHPPAENKAAVMAAAGKHRVRVEHFEIDGFAQLGIWIRPRQPGAAH